MRNGFVSAFKDIGVDLIEKKGVSCIPIMYDDKMPAFWSNSAGGWVKMRKWNQFSQRLATPEEYKLWAEMPDCNVGVCVGELSGVIALDFDNHEEIHQKILKEIKPSPVGKIGKIGVTYFYKYNGEKSRSWKHPETQKTVVELLSNGKQTVIPPSQHPNLLRYEWVDEKKTLLNFDDLPTLPEDYFNIIERCIGVPKKNPAKTFIKSEGDLGDVQKALDHISPNLGYERWLGVGMALHSWSNGQAFDMWNNWSAKSAEKYKPEEMQSKWDSLTGSGINISTVFWEAKLNGFIIAQQLKADFQIPESFFGGTKKRADKPEVNLTISPNLIASAPNIVGEIQKWIVSCSIYPQPELALAAAITLVGAVKGGRVCSETNLRTNMYLLGVAPASSGKEHAMKCCEVLLREAGLEAIFGGTPASDSGLLASLERNNRRLIMWDEVGKGMEALNSSNSSTYQAQILTALMSLFSKAGSTFFGKEYAKRDGKQVVRQDIEEPCLGVYGLTTGGALYDSLSEDMIANGFLSRWLVFEPREPLPIKRVGFKPIIAPTELVDALQIIEDTLGEKGIGSVRKPKIVPFSPEATVLLEELEVKYHAKKLEAFEKMEGLQSYWGRAIEHIIKLSLIVSDDSTIQYSNVFWSAQIVETCVINLLGTSERLSISSFGKLVEKVEKKLEKEKEGISLGQFFNQTRKMWEGIRERDDAIKMLHDCGVVVVGDIETEAGNIVKGIQLAKYFGGVK